MDPKGGVENGLTRSNKGLQTKSKLGTWQSNLIQYKDMRYIYSDQSIMQVSSQSVYTYQWTIMLLGFWPTLNISHSQWVKQNHLQYMYMSGYTVLSLWITSLYWGVNKLDASKKLNFQHLHLICHIVVLTAFNDWTVDARH